MYNVAKAVVSLRCRVGMGSRTNSMSLDEFGETLMTEACRAPWLGSLPVRADWLPLSPSPADSGRRLAPLLPQSYHQQAHPHAGALCLHLRLQHAHPHSSGLAQRCGGGRTGGLRSG